MCTILNGIVVYDNNIMLPTDKWVFFITGVGAAIFGVVALAKTHADKYYVE
jgi:hypothetical protein